MTEIRSILLRRDTIDDAIDAFLPLQWHYNYDEERMEPTMERFLSYGESDAALMSLSVVQRIGGVLSLLGGLYIFLRAWKRRHGPFDRIMMGLAFHTMLWGIYHMWGTAAIPEGTPGVHGARGTTTTCSIQGFLFQISMVVPFYYVFLSLYSWVVVLHGNFDPANYQWIEKYIHVGVHIYPIASAIYLLSIESFNSNGLHCWIASIPSGCGEKSGIECTRGPQNPHVVLWAFGGIPAIFFLLFPTLVMVTLTYCVYLRQGKPETETLCVIPVSMVAKQSAIYLGSLYWVYLPLFVYNGMNFFHDESPYGVALWVNLVTNSMGIWLAIVYWYFSTEENCNDSGSDDEIHTKEDSNITPTDVMDHDRDKDLDTTGVIDEEKSEAFANLATKKPSNRWSSTNATTLMAGSHTTLASARTSRRMSRTSKRFSFNIFDGTASSGMFAAFVFEGDSDDEEKDAAESRQWEHCQGMNSDR